MEFGGWRGERGASPSPQLLLFFNVMQRDDIYVWFFKATSLSPHHSPQHTRCSLLLITTAAVRQHCSSPCTAGPMPGPETGNWFHSPAFSVYKHLLGRMQGTGCFVPHPFTNGLAQRPSCSDECQAMAPPGWLLAPDVACVTAGGREVASQPCWKWYQLHLLLVREVHSSAGLFPRITQARSSQLPTLLTETRTANLQSASGPASGNGRKNLPGPPFTGPRKGGKGITSGPFLCSEQEAEVSSNSQFSNALQYNWKQYRRSLSHTLHNSHASDCPVPPLALSSW